jgi:hypothetical protein
VSPGVLGGGVPRGALDYQALGTKTYDDPSEASPGGGGSGGFPPGALDYQVHSNMLIVYLHLMLFVAPNPVYNMQFSHLQCRGSLDGQHSPSRGRQSCRSILPQGP